MLNVVKMEMHSGADRNAFGNLALDFCRAAKAVSGVNSANYFWVNPNLIGFIIDFQDGAWGQQNDNTHLCIEIGFANGGA